MPHSQTNFRAEDMISHGGKKGGGDDTKKSKPAAKEKDKDEVPDGTIDEVLGWVGDDNKRARQALNHEKKADTPRKGLVTELEERLKR